jgi:hypothetical protein
MGVSQPPLQISADECTICLFRNDGFIGSIGSGFGVRFEVVSRLAWAVLRYRFRRVVTDDRLADWSFSMLVVAPQYSVLRLGCSAGFPRTYNGGDGHRG